MIRQMIKVMVCALPVCLLAANLNACDSGSQNFEGMLKVRYDACAAKEGAFLAEANYQCTCNGMPLGNMEICMNQVTPMTCDPESVVKICQYVQDEAGNTIGSQWKYCRYGFWEYGEVMTDSECRLCDSSIEPSCDEKNGVSGVTSCVGGVWEFKPCEYGCANEHECNDCMNDEKKCLDDVTLMICVDGAYKSKKCAGGCKDNDCASVCTEGEKICADDGRFRRFCKNEDWTIESCNRGCENGDCVGVTGNGDICDGNVVCENIPVLQFGGLRCSDSEDTNSLKSCDLPFISCKNESECGDCLNGDDKCEDGIYYKCIDGEWKNDEKPELCILRRM